MWTISYQCAKESKEIKIIINKFNIPSDERTIRHYNLKLTWTFLFLDSSSSFPGSSSTFPFLS
ncbi:hypothetical protein BpHYR1_051136 [Brachionus plicatilis]|uniref:Uncharacterized protein n=1 Tax=Brachionus plicatilis TaxID=10195 RepID=A0A3M7S0Z5_BRAPC|nr:hypothetical protein BpHYR1_051136 [Brachionus plicatilis]